MAAIPRTVDIEHDGRVDGITCEFGVVGMHHHDDDDDLHDHCGDGQDERTVGLSEFLREHLNMVCNRHGRIDDDSKKNTEADEVACRALDQAVFKIADTNGRKDGKKKTVLFGELPEKLHHFMRSL